MSAAYSELQEYNDNLPAVIPEGFKTMHSRAFTEVYLEGLAAFIFEADISLLS